MMEFKVEVRSFAKAELRSHYDLIYAVLGYEARARYAMEQLRPKGSEKVAWGFGVQEEMAYQENLRFFKKQGFDCTPISENAHALQFSNVLSDIRSTRTENVGVLVDISSATRRRLAEVMWELACHSAQKSISADFLYTLAQFQRPSKRNTRNSDAGPVSSAFAGWWSEPERPIAAVVGLGYEEDKALGMVEHLQAPDVWTFEPRSLVSEYTAALELANKRLIELVPEAHHLSYSVEQPYQTFLALESLVDGLSRDWNTILVPFGPKIFTLISMLVALRRQGLPVWRVSAGVLQRPRDAKAAGPIYGLRVIFRGGNVRGGGAISLQNEKRGSDGNHSLRSTLESA
jgi:hypothetical protein